MNDFLSDSSYFGLIISILAYAAGLFIKEKCRLRFLNPLVVAAILIISFLLLTGTSYEVYHASAKYLSWLLTPATVCLALPLYREIELLKNNKRVILISLLVGVFTSIGCVFLMAWLFDLSQAETATLLPKSITTAIGMGIAEELGGFPAIAAAVIILTGVVGNVSAKYILRLFKITEPLAKGLGIGAASHAIGTSRAMEMGSQEGAASSLAIVVSGLLTILILSVYAAVLS